MKSLTIQLPDELAARIEAEAVERKMPISDVIRKYLNLAHSHNPRRALFEAITDVVRSAVTPLPHAERSPDRALFDAITDVVRSAEQLVDDAERSSHSDPLPDVERSPDADPLSDAARSPEADPLPDADASSDDPSTRKKAASRRAKRSESAP